MLQVTMYPLQIPCNQRSCSTTEENIDMMYLQDTIMHVISFLVEDAIYFARSPPDAWEADRSDITAYSSSKYASRRPNLII
jgi:hypothetical protein